MYKKLTLILILSLLVLSGCGDSTTDTSGDNASDSSVQYSADESNDSAPEDNDASDSSTQESEESDDAQAETPPFTSADELIEELYLGESDGYIEMSNEEFETQYGESLCAPDYLPENFEHYEKVYVRENPGIPGQYIYTQIWYDPVTFEFIQVSQSEGSGYPTEGNFYFSDHDEAATPINENYPWVNYRGGYTENGEINITATIFVREEDDRGECEKILTSISN